MPAPVTATPIDAYASMGVAVTGAGMMLLWRD
jgi:hypothetical protein